MAVSVGEVNATLRFTIQQQDIAAAKANLRDLGEQFRAAGGDATSAGQAILNQMIPAQAQLDRLNVSAAATKAELAAISKAGDGMENVAAKAALGTTEMSKFEGVATRMLERLAVLYALRETFDFVKGLYEASDALVHMADVTGYSIDELDRWGRMAADVDIPTQQIDKSLTQLQKNLVEMKPATSDALHDLGLNFTEILSLKPDDQLEAIATALSGIASPAERAALEIKLFGTDGIDPLIKNLARLKEATKDGGIDPETHKILAQTVESYKQVGNAISEYAAKGFAELIDLTSRAATPFFAFWSGGLEAVKIAATETHNLKTDIAEVVDEASKQPGPLMGQAFIDSLKQEVQYTREQYDALKQLKDMHELTAENAVRAADVTTAQYKAIAGAIEDAEKAAKALAKQQAEQAKLEEIQQLDSEKRWAEYADVVTRESGTANQRAIADINKWAATVTEAAVRGKRDTEDFYVWLAAESKAKLAGVGINWADLRKNSIETLQETYLNAQATFVAMSTDGLHHSQDQIQHFRDIRDAALDALHGISDNAKKTQKDLDDMTTALVNTASSDKQFNKQMDYEHSTTWAAFDADLNSQIKNVKTLSDEWITASEAKKRFDQGSTFTYDLSTEQGLAQYKKMNPVASISWSDQQIMDYAKKGGTLQGLVETGVINPYGNMRTNSGFAEGGVVDVTVGERGPEVVRTPIGSTVFPTGTTPPGGAGGVNMTNHFYVNGTVTEAADKVADIFMRRLKYSRQYGAA